MVGICVHFFVLLIEALAFTVTCFSGHMHESSCLHGARGQLLIAINTVRTLLKFVSRFLQLTSHLTMYCLYYCRLLVKLFVLPSIIQCQCKVGIILQCLTCIIMFTVVNLLVWILAPELGSNKFTSYIV